MVQTRYSRVCSSVAILLISAIAYAGRPAPMSLVFRDDFEQGAEHWQPTDSAAWKIEAGSDGAIYRLFAASDYKPTFRSPFNVAIVRGVVVGDFSFDVKLKSTKRDYDHRDLCLIFGYQDAEHFYYVHFGKKTDDHANQIFIVNGAARTMISTKTTPGTAWDEAWHRVRVVRNIEAGTIEVFFDDMNTPVMTATDTTFKWGEVGIGSFDDTGDFDDVELRGTLVKRPKP